MFKTVRPLLFAISTAAVAGAVVSIPYKVLASPQSRNVAKDFYEGRVRISTQIISYNCDPATRNLVSGKWSVDVTAHELTSQSTILPAFPLIRFSFVLNPNEQPSTPEFAYTFPTYKQMGLAMKAQWAVIKETEEVCAAPSDRPPRDPNNLSSGRSAPSGAPPPAP